MKLKKLSDIFNTQRMKQHSKRVQKDTAILDKETAQLKALCDCICQMFPKEHDIARTLIGLEFAKPEELPTAMYTSDFLPFHLYDNEWLAKCLTQVAESKEFKNKFKIANANAFVQASPLFEIERNNYIERLMNVQLKHMLRNPVPNALIDGMCPYDYQYIKDYDKQFREQVIRSFTKLGIDKYRVEVFLEKNSQLWLPESMEIAFENECYPISKTKFIYPTKSQKKVLQHFQQAHKKVWMQRRLYDYGQEHQSILKEVGLFAPTMEMKPKELQRLDKRLAKYQQASVVLLQACRNMPKQVDDRTM